MDRKAIKTKALMMVIMSIMILLLNIYNALIQTFVYREQMILVTFYLAGSILGVIGWVLLHIYGRGKINLGYIVLPNLLLLDFLLLIAIALVNHVFNNQYYYWYRKIGASEYFWVFVIYLIVQISILGWIIVRFRNEKVSGQKKRLLAIPTLCAVLVFAGTIIPIKQQNTGFAKYLDCDDDRLYRQSKMVAVGDAHTVAIKEDGAILATGDNSKGQCNVSSWKGARAVAAYQNDTIILFADGTVKTTGENHFKGVSEWINIVDIAAGEGFVAGLNQKGRVMIAGEFDSKKKVLNNIRAITAERTRLLALNHKRQVKMLGVSWNENDQKTIIDLDNINYLSSGLTHTVFVDEKGKAKAIGTDWCGETELTEWDRIKAVYAGSEVTVGLKQNGRLLLKGNLDAGVSELVKEKKVVAVAIGKNHTVALKADGTIVAFGANNNGQCDVQNWKCKVVLDN